MSRLYSNLLLLFAVVALLGTLLVVMPANSQEAGPALSAPPAGDRVLRLNLADWAPDSSTRASFFGPNYFAGFIRPPQRLTLLPKPFQTVESGRIETMEAAFSCNDTPFVDQVRLPVAALWHGRVRFTGFESDVTTANFVLGLPGGGTLHSLSLTGSGYLAMRTPPSDQLVGMHVTFNLGGGETGAGDNSGLRGMQYLVRTSRDFLQTFLPR